MHTCLSVLPAHLCNVWFSILHRPEGSSYSVSLHYLEHLAVWTWYTFRPGERLSFPELRVQTEQLNYYKDAANNVAVKHFGEYFDNVIQAMAPFQVKDKKLSAKQGIDCSRSASIHLSIPLLQPGDGKYEQIKGAYPVVPVLRAHNLFASQ